MYISLQEGSERYATSVKSLRRRIADGSLKAYRIGPRAIRVKVEDLEALLRPIPAGGDHVA